MRVFIAAEIPEKIKDYLEKIQNELKCLAIRASWVKRQNHYLTLIFFYEINPKQAKSAAEILKEKNAGKTIIELKTSDLGAFPSLDSPRTLWVGLTGNLDELQIINQNLREKLASQKIPFDPKPFVPHLTLGRLRKMKTWQRKKISRILKQFLLKEKPKFRIKQISLIKSQLTSQGPIYQNLEKISLVWQ